MGQDPESAENAIEGKRGGCSGWRRFAIRRTAGCTPTKMNEYMPPDQESPDSIPARSTEFTAPMVLSCRGFSIITDPSPIVFLSAVIYLCLVEMVPGRDSEKKVPGAYPRSFQPERELRL